MCVPRRHKKNVFYISLYTRLRRSPFPFIACHYSSEHIRKNWAPVNLYSFAFVFYLRTSRRDINTADGSPGRICFKGSSDGWLFWRSSVSFSPQWACVYVCVCVCVFVFVCVWVHMCMLMCLYLDHVFIYQFGLSSYVSLIFWGYCTNFIALVICSPVKL